MGFMDDMKKLFWAKKSVAKSAAKKGAEEFKDAANEGYDVVVASVRVTTMRHALSGNPWTGTPVLAGPGEA